MARTLVVVPRRPRKAAKSTSNAVWRLAPALWRYLSQLATLPDRGATLDDLPPEFFRFRRFRRSR
jgi:hypothetical protein